MNPSGHHAIFPARLRRCLQVPLGAVLAGCLAAAPAARADVITTYDLSDVTAVMQDPANLNDVTLTITGSFVFDNTTETQLSNNITLYGASGFSADPYDLLDGSYTVVFPPPPGAPAGSGVWTSNSLQGEDPDVQVYLYLADNLDNEPGGSGDPITSVFTFQPGSDGYGDGCMQITAPCELISLSVTGAADPEVAEPASLALLGTGLAMLGWICRRKLAD